MKTTLHEIKKHNPCLDGWAKLLKSLDKDKADDEPLSLEYILKSNGIGDAVWALRCLEYKDYCLFNADVAESVLHFFEEEYPKDKRPREVIEAIRKWYRGEITDNELFAASASASAASAASPSPAVLKKFGYAAISAASTHNHSNISTAAASASATTSYAAASASATASYTAASAFVAASSNLASRKEKWLEIEILFVKHFCKGKE